MGDFFRFQKADFSRYEAEARVVAVFEAPFAEELHAETDPEEGLTFRGPGNKTVGPAGGPEPCRGGAEGAHSGKDGQGVFRRELRRGGEKPGFLPEGAEGTADVSRIAHLVVDDGDHTRVPFVL
ncbi:hypothetical protein SDC9_83938 [bioreactor metagenome]|uniref:Uncharacterized protein n=1 Tax=bioreactor metagenome TaxID=1076179 RepID=A0A644ZAK8_9ZZZZ